MGGPGYRVRGRRWTLAGKLAERQRQLRGEQLGEGRPSGIELAGELECTDEVPGAGRDEDPMAVVDPQLQVRGVTGLRIGDASIMPRIPGANTNAPTMVIADRCVDLMTQPAFAKAAETARTSQLLGG